MSCGGEAEAESAVALVMRSQKKVTCQITNNKHRSFCFICGFAANVVLVPLDSAGARRSRTMGLLYPCKVMEEREARQKQSCM